MSFSCFFLFFTVSSAEQAEERLVTYRCGLWNETCFSCFLLYQVLSRLRRDLLHMGVDCGMKPVILDEDLVLLSIYKYSPEKFSVHKLDFN